MCRSPTSVAIRRLALEQIERDEKKARAGGGRSAVARGNSPGSLAPIASASRLHNRIGGRASVLGGPDRVTPRADPLLLRKIASAPDSQHFPLYFRDTAASPSPPTGSPFSSPTKVRASRFGVSRSPSPSLLRPRPPTLRRRASSPSQSAAAAPDEPTSLLHAADFARDLQRLAKGRGVGAVLSLLTSHPHSRSRGAPSSEGNDKGWGALLDATALPGGRTALQESCFYGQGARAAEILGLGADPDHTHHAENPPPLVLACQFGHPEAVRALVAAGASVHLPDDEGRTPLHAACEEGHVECCELVLREGASIRAKTKEGRTPMQLATADSVRALFRGQGGSRPTKDLFERGESRVESGAFRWKKGNLLGEGAYGRVYAGLCQETGSLMAVKQIPVDCDDEGRREQMKQLQREIDVYKTLRHEHIVGYLGAYLSKEDSLMYVFLEYVSGGSISSMLKRFGPFSEALSRIYVRQILCGLAFLHANRCVHRDIKGANILITQEGSAKLADFGASKRYASAENSGSGLSDSKSILGSVYWMAPEVMKGTGHGRRADVWSLG